MIIDLKCVQEILLTAEKHNLEGVKNFDRTILKEHIEYLIINGYITRSENPLSKSDCILSIGDLTKDKGQNFITLFRDDDDFTDEIVKELKERNTDSLEVAYEIAFNRKSAPK
ncbi:MAG: hypothetical protein EPN82_16355 [Bacteroidetes bacterium]|nr:MAG: hypothetical protein EPN82_16355 [Bacteroidota bacterium]